MPTDCEYLRRYPNCTWARQLQDRITNETTQRQIMDQQILEISVEHITLENGIGQILSNPLLSTSPDVIDIGTF